MLNVLLTRRFFQRDIDYIESRLKPGIVLLKPDDYSVESLVRYAHDADVFFGPLVSAELCSAAPKLRFIQVPWTGVDNVDLKLAQDLGVRVCNSHSNASAVAEHAVALYFALAKKLVYHDRMMRQGCWNRPLPDGSNAESPFSYRIGGSNIGLLGCGHIGSQIVKYLAPYDCRFHIVDIDPNQSLYEKYKVVYYPPKSMDEMFATVDCLFVCMPLTEATRGLLSADRLAKLKPQAFVVNTSRAEIVDEAALYKTLESRSMAGAAMDVWYNAPSSPAQTDVPPSLHYPFHKLDNILLSPHRAAMVASELPHLDGAIENLNRTVSGLPLINIVSCGDGF